MLRNMYRVILEKFDPVDAEQAILVDWKNDARGKDLLSRQAFCDALFELADMWTAGICPYECAARTHHS